MKMGDGIHVEIDINNCALAIVTKAYANPIVVSAVAFIENEADPPVRRFSKIKHKPVGEREPGTQWTPTWHLSNACWRKS